MHGFDDVKKAFLFSFDMESREGRWTFYPHTADAKFKAYGRTCEEMFANAGVACFEVVTETEKVGVNQEFRIEARSHDLEALLFDFLDELLFLLDTEGFIVAGFRDMVIEKVDEGYSLQTTVVGDHYKGYDVSCNVKAVTYNDMYVRGPEVTNIETGNTGAWECQVVVDL